MLASGLVFRNGDNDVPSFNRMQQVLAAYSAVRNEPFVWGENDCLALVALCLPEGVEDPTAELRSRYSSERQAKSLMVKNGWKSVGDVAASFWPEKPKSLAKTGNCAEVSNPDGSTVLGVVVGSRVIARVETGTAQVNMDRVLRVFEC